MERLKELDLDEYSRLAVSLILNRFPDWERFAKLSSPDGGASAVEFDIPCPSPAVDHGLWVSPSGEELTIGFHTHHNHFTTCDDEPRTVMIEAGLQLISDILGNRSRT